MVEPGPFPSPEEVHDEAGRVPPPATQGKDTRLVQLRSQLPGEVATVCEESRALTHSTSRD